MELRQKKLNYDLTDEETRKILFYEINNHLLLDDAPSHFLNSIIDTNVFKEYPYSMLRKLRDTEQSPVHHPEGDVWKHTMLVIDNAAVRKNNSRDERVFMWAALLHDIGKPDTTAVRKGKVTSYDHEKVGAVLACNFLKEFTNDSKFINNVAVLVKYHMQILHVVKNLPFADIPSMKAEVDIMEIALLGFCDRLGRLNVNIEKEQSNVSLFIKKCNEK